MVLSYHVGPVDGTQVIRLDSMCLLLLSRLQPLLLEGPGMIFPKGSTGNQMSNDVMGAGVLQHSLILPTSHQTQTWAFALSPPSWLFFL